MSNQQENSRSSSSSSSPITDDAKAVATNPSLPLIAPTPSRCCLRCLHQATMLREGGYFCRHCNRSTIVSSNDNIRQLTSHENVVVPSAGLTPASNTAHGQKSGNAPTNVASTPNVVDATSICGRCNGKVTITSGNNCFCPECNCAVLVIGEPEEPSGSAFPQAMASGEHEDEVYCGGCEEWRWIDTVNKDGTCRYCDHKIGNNLTQLEARFEQWEADMRANPAGSTFPQAMASGEHKDEFYCGGCEEWRWIETLNEDGTCRYCDRKISNSLTQLEARFEQWDADMRAQERRDAQIAEDSDEDGVHEDFDEGEFDEDISGADVFHFGQE